MWDLENHTPFPAAAGFQRDHMARSYWCVWLRAAFAIRHDLPLDWLPDQPGLLRQPLMADGPGGPDLLADGDFRLPKARPDVLVHAAVVPPRGIGVAQAFPLGFRLGTLEKRLAAHPPRLRTARGTVQSFRPPEEPAFRAGHGWAYGGPDHPENPVGCGHGARPGREVVLPRLSRLGQDPAEGRIDPVALTGIAEGWPSRARLAGSFDEAWLRLRAPLPPADQDPAFRQSAPPDQRHPGPLTGGEAAMFLNLSPLADQDGLLRLALPRLQFDLQTRFRKVWVAQDMALQTVLADLIAGRLFLTYAAALPVPGAHNDVEVEKSRLILTGHQGFTVSPEAVDPYHAALEGQEWA